MTHMNQKKWITSFLGLLTLLSAAVSASTAYQIEVEFKNKKSRQGYATKVNDSTFITDAEIVGSASTVYIINSTVKPATKVLAEIKSVDEKARVAIIAAGGLPGDPVTFGKSNLAVGRSLSQTIAGKSMKGTVIKFDSEEDLLKGQKVYTHQMLYAKDQWAAPLFNNCKEFVGMNVAKTGVFSGMEAPEEFAHAIDSETLAKYLAAKKVEFKVATDDCLSAVEQAKKKAEDIAKEQEALKKKLEEKEQSEKELTDKLKKEAEEADKAKKEADKAKQDAEKANKEKEAKAEAAKKELEKKEKETAEKLKKAEEENKKKEQEASKRQQMIYGGIGAVVVILIIITVVILSKRKRLLKEKEAQIDAKSQQANNLAAQKQDLQQALEQFKKTFNDILLEGVDSTGAPVRIKISGKMLAQQGTQLLGRDSNSVDYLLADEEVSRQHLRLSIEGEQLAIEDLGSHNGTALNGQPLTSGQKTVVSDGSEIVLSTAKLKVKYL